MSKIPVYIMEEHHEAFYYWNYFIECGLIPPKHNYLLHIDHHDDMEAGGYDWDFRIPWESLEQIRTFTYEKLGIADFITPALYQGIFDTVHIMKNLLHRAQRWNFLYSVWEKAISGRESIFHLFTVDIKERKIQITVFIRSEKTV